MISSASMWLTGCQSFPQKKPPSPKLHADHTAAIWASSCESANPAPRRMLSILCLLAFPAVGARSAYRRTTVSSRASSLGTRPPSASMQTAQSGTLARCMWFITKSTKLLALSGRYSWPAYLVPSKIYDTSRKLHEGSSFKALSSTKLHVCWSLTPSLPAA